MQVTYYSTLSAKQMANWGKIYDVTYNSVTPAYIPAVGVNVHDYLQVYFNQIIQDAINGLDPNGTYTIVFPARDYIIQTAQTPLNNDHLIFDIRQTNLTGVHFNFIGINVDYANGSLGSMPLAIDKETYINNHLVSTDIQIGNINNPNYLSSIAPTAMPKWIWTPMNGNVVQNTCNSQLFCLFNNITPCPHTLASNSVNFMGIEIQGEAYGNWGNLQDHPYMNRRGKHYAFLKLNMWKNVYVDNNYFHDHYGQGISISYNTGRSGYTYCNLPNQQLEELFYQNEDVEVNNNIIRNSYGFNPQPIPYNINGVKDDGGDAIYIEGIDKGMIEKNIVYNDLAITGMCGRLGIGGESFTNCQINNNMINGYNRDIHIEIDKGNNLISKNRCTGTFCNVLLSSRNGDVNPNIITNNYFSNENIPLDNILWPWEGMSDQPLSYAMHWAYDNGMVYLVKETGTIAKGTTISHNDFFIDANSGSGTATHYGHFIYFNALELAFNLDMHINCNTFTHNHTGTDNYGIFIESITLAKKDKIIKEFYGNSIINSNGSGFYSYVPFSTDINYFHDNVVTGGSFATQAALGVFPNFTTPSTASFCCTDEETNTNVSKIYLENPQATNLPYNTYNNTTFYIKGPFDIDHDMTFNNCIFYFTSNGSMNLQGVSILDLNACTLQASCDYWQGIIADDPQQKVILQNHSYIKKAGIGLHASNGAVVDVTDSHFEDNFQYGIYLNNTTAPYAGIINHNTFTMQANLPANPFPPIKAGIHLYDVAQLNIGDIGNANTENHFEGLYTGIWVTNHDFNTASNIGIYNCSFKNINNTALTGNYIESQKINNCYNSARGAGVFANYTGLPNLATRLIDVRNTAAANVNLKFENCDKGIVSSALPVKAKNLYLKDCLIGCNNINTDGKVYDVQDNTLENVFLGMQFIGDNANSIVKGNTISSPTAISAVQTAPQNYIWPVAIDVRNLNNNTANQFVIKENIITMKDYAGLGINLLNTGKEANAFKNTIGLTSTNQGVIVCAGATLLNGIYATNAFKTKMEGNHVNGNANLLIPAREDIAGIYLNKSTYNELHCNFVNNTRFGIMAQANCLTNPDAVKGNSLFNHVLGWVFRKLGPEGTFGDVGTQTFDNNNLFAGNNYVFRVFKFCEIGYPDKIYTNPNTLTQFQSNSEDINNQAANTCPYLVGQNQIPFTTYICPVNLNAVPNNTATTIDLPNAIAIATNTKMYSAFPEISQWIDMRMLYKILESDSVFRNSNDTLLNFYDSLQNVDIANIENAESSMNTLIESMESQNYELYLQRIAEAEQSNSNIVSQTMQEANEKDINAIYLKILRYGLDTLSDEDSIRIEELALKCPYIGGTAVYKARALYAMYAPASMFDDIKICNAVGVYKNGSGNNEDKKGIFDSENNYLRNIKARPATTEIASNEILLYPNPSESQLNIRYNFDKDSKLQIVDMLGIIVKEVFLSKETKQVSLFVNDLAPGVYSYRQIYQNTTLNTGKLIISK
jgi:hypothetical protein